MKDSAKGAAPLWPITYLPTTLKLLTGVGADAIQQHLLENKLFPSEKKGNYLNSRETEDQFLIEKMIFGKLQEKEVQLECSKI